MSERKDCIVKFIIDSINNYEYYGAVIGISGGIDSAVVAKLLVDALGKDRVFGLLMPERDSSPDTLKDSKLICKFLGIKYRTINISHLLRKMEVYSMKPPSFIFPRVIKERYAREQWENIANPYIADLKTCGGLENRKNHAYYRIKHRIRMTNLYFEAEKRRYAVIGTTNKTENDLGFFVKWGDEASDIDPILHLYKTEVFELAEELGIPKKIIDKPPSPDIAPGITDEYALGMSYADIDKILYKIHNGLDLIDENKDNINKVKLILDNVKYRKVKNLNLLNLKARDE